MKSRAVVESLIRECLEILDGFWRDVRPEFQCHLAGGGFDDRHFVWLRAHVPFDPAASYLMESAGTILTDFTSMRFVGLLGSPLRLATTGVSLIFLSTSSPLINFPKAVYL